MLPLWKIFVFEVILASCCRPPTTTDVEGIAVCDEVLRLDAQLLPMLAAKDWIAVQNAATPPASIYPIAHVLTTTHLPINAHEKADLMTLLCAAGPCELRRASDGLR